MVFTPVPMPVVAEFHNCTLCFHQTILTLSVYYYLQVVYWTIHLTRET